MFDPKLKIKKSIYDKLRVAAQITGCSIEELAEKILDTEAEKIVNSGSNKELNKEDIDAIANQLKGLGYLE